MLTNLNQNPTKVSFPASFLKISKEQEKLFLFVQFFNVCVTHRTNDSEKNVEEKKENGKNIDDKKRSKKSQKGSSVKQGAASSVLMHLKHYLL